MLFSTLIFLLEAPADLKKEEAGSRSERIYLKLSKPLFTKGLCFPKLYFFRLDMYILHLLDNETHLGRTRSKCEEWQELNFKKAFLHS